MHPLTWGTLNLTRYFYCSTKYSFIMGLSYLYTMCERSKKCYADRKATGAKANEVKTEQSEKEPAQKKTKSK